MTAEYDEVLEETRNLGRLAYKRRENPSDNPYRDSEPAMCKAWAQGYKEAYYKDGQRGGPA